MKENNIMRPLLAFLASILISFSAHSAGIYAGIWQSTTTGAFVLVNQNGNFFIVTTYSNIPAQNIYVPFNNGQKYLVSSLDIGDLISGPLVGDTAVLSGIAAFRACNVTISATFMTPTMFMAQFLASTPTAEGAAQGINCAQIRNNSIAATGLVQYFVKVF